LPISKSANFLQKHQVGKLKCPLKLDDMGAVIIVYIAYFTMKESKFLNNYLLFAIGGIAGITLLVGYFGTGTVKNILLIKTTVTADN
jgi:hypothetical protein